MGKKEQEEDNRDIFEKALDGGALPIGGAAIGALAARYGTRALSRQQRKALMQDVENAMASGKFDRARTATRKLYEGSVNRFANTVVGGVTGAGFGGLGERVRQDRKRDNRKRK